jgi:hypothetical protein
MGRRRKMSKKGREHGERNEKRRSGREKDKK